MRPPRRPRGRPAARRAPGGDLPEGDGQPARGPLPVGPRPWPRTSDAGWPTSRSRPIASPGRPGSARWSRRHRTAVASAAALLVTAGVALAVCAVLIGRERDEARLQRQQARQAVDDMYTEVAEKWLEDRLDPLQREFLEKALAYYRVRRARRRRPGRPPGAGAGPPPDGRHPPQARPSRRGRGRLPPVDRDPLGASSAEPPRRRPSTASHLAEATARLASELATRGKAADLAEAEKLYRQAAAIQARRSWPKPASAPRRLALARTLDGLADLLRVTGRPDEAEAAYRRAVALLEKAAAEGPGEVEPRQELAAALDGLGVLLEGAGPGRRGRGGRPPGRRALREARGRGPQPAPGPRRPGQGVQQPGPPRPRAGSAAESEAPPEAGRAQRAARRRLPRPARIPPDPGPRADEPRHPPPRGEPAPGGRADPSPGPRPQREARGRVRPGSGSSAATRPPA